VAIELVESEEKRTRVFLKLPDKDDSGPVMFRDIDSKMSLSWMVQQLGLISQPIHLRGPEGEIEYEVIKTPEGSRRNRFRANSTIGEPWLFVTMLPGASNAESMRRNSERYVETTQKKDSDERLIILEFANAYFAKMLPEDLQEVVRRAETRPFWWVEEDSNQSIHGTGVKMDDSVRLTSTPIMEYARS